jgi:hypothetical protein
VSSQSPREYEFTPEQNSLIGALASRMRTVGLFLILIAVLNFLFTVVVVLVIYRAKLPQHYVETVLTKVSEVAKTDVRAQLANLPPDTHLWGAAICSGVNFLLYLLLGVWTRQTASSWSKIVETQGKDISHLMNGMAALNRMYTLICTLILIGLLVFLAALGLFLYAHFTR